MAIWLLVVILGMTFPVWRTGITFPVVPDNPPSLQLWWTGSGQMAPAKPGHRTIPLKKSMIQSVSYRRLLIGIAFAVIGVILVFGLRPKGFRFTNQATWIPDTPGIRFGNYGIAYTPLSNKKGSGSVSESVGFSIEIALKSEGSDKEGFRFILALHDGRDRDQLIVAQYLSYLVVMNGDDYANKRRTGRIVVKEDYDPQKRTFLSIVTSEEGSKVYIDGRLAKSKKNMRLKMPQEAGTPWLVVGNSVYGQHSWRGDVYGLALYRDELQEEDVKSHYSRWSTDQTFSFARQEDPALLYLFDEKDGVEALDSASGNHHLRIPKRMHILKKRVLSMPWVEFELNTSFIQDLTINLLGFIPLGFILCAIFIEFGEAPGNRYMLITVASCFAVSLSIELAQAWLPSRSSQMSDLMLNTVGGFIGTLAGRIGTISRRARRGHRE